MHPCSSHPTTASHTVSSQAFAPTSSSTASLSSFSKSPEAESFLPTTKILENGLSRLGVSYPIGFGSSLGGRIKKICRWRRGVIRAVSRACMKSLRNPGRSHPSSKPDPQFSVPLPCYGSPNSLRVFCRIRDMWIRFHCCQTWLIADS